MNTKRFLIVDDREDNRYLLKSLLHSYGHDVETAAHGADALDKARQDPPNMIISDILMPVMDGFVLCHECKNDERLRRIPFVFYTATYVDDRDREFALSLGADAFIIKPAEPDKFMEVIEETFRIIEKPSAATKPVTASLPEESVYLKRYNEILIHKLEAKMVHLEEINKQLNEDIVLRKISQEQIRRLNDELEKIVAERTAELNRKIRELEELNRVFVNRELKISDLKMRIAELENICLKQEKDSKS